MHTGKLRRFGQRLLKVNFAEKSPNRRIFERITNRSMDELLLQMASDMKRRPAKRKKIEEPAKRELTSQQQDERISSFRSWIHTPIEPEKRMRSFCAAEKLGIRSSSTAVVKISNIFPNEVAEGK